MTNNGDFYRIDKMLPYKKTRTSRALIGDKDLQIHMTHARDAANIESAGTNKSLFSHYMQETAGVTSQAAVQQPTNEIGLAMQNMEESYNVMMQIHSQLMQHYEGIKDMQNAE